MIKGVIYDLDGLMVNSEPLHVKTWEILLKKYSCDFNSIPEEIYKTYIGKRVIEIAEKIRTYFKINEPLEIFYRKRIETFMNLASAELKEMPGLYTSLDLFKKNNFKIGLASSGAKEYIDLILDKFKIRNYFDVIITGDCVTKGKPNPEPYLIASKKLGLNPKECVVLEDAENGILSAKSAGCKCIGVIGYDFPKQDRSKADLVIDFLENIRQVETKLLMPVEPVETTLLELLPSIVEEDDVLKKQQQIIEELKIPPFLTMLKMRNSVITPKEPEEEENTEEEEYPEDVEYLTQLRAERRESKKKQDELWKRMSDTKLEPLPNDRDVIAAIIFINKLIIERAELKIPPLPVDVNSVNVNTLKSIRKPLFKYVDPQNVETKTESQDLIKYWNILKRRYQPQSAGKKKKRQYKPLNK